MAEGIRLDALRYTIGSSTVDATDIPGFDGEFLTTLGSFEYDLGDESFGFGTYDVPEGGSPQFGFERLETFVSVVTSSYGADGLKINHAFSGNFEVAITIIDPFGDYEEYFFDANQISEDTYYWFNGAEWLLGDENGLLSPDAGLDTAPGALLGTNFDDVLTDTGAPNEIYGFFGDDIVEARKGDDTIFGGSGKAFDYTIFDIEMVTGGQGGDRIEAGDGPAVTLDGQGGDDRIIGGDRGDTLIDGSGADKLRGNGGADTFVMVADGDRDLIRDFEVGHDRIDVSQWGATDLGDLTVKYSDTRLDRVLVTFNDEALMVRTSLPNQILSEDDFLF